MRGIMAGRHILSWRPPPPIAARFSGAECGIAIQNGSFSCASRSACRHQTLTERCGETFNLVRCDLPVPRLSPGQSAPGAADQLRRSAWRSLAQTLPARSGARQHCMKIANVRNVLRYRGGDLLRCFGGHGRRISLSFSKTPIRPFLMWSYAPAVCGRCNS